MSPLPGIYVDICLGGKMYSRLSRWSTARGSIFLFFYYPLSSGIASCYGTVMPTLDAALLCSSWAGADQGHKSGLVWGALSIGFPHSQVDFNVFGRRDNQKFEDEKIISQIVKNSLICDQNGGRVPRNNKVAIFAVFDLKVFLYDMNNMWFCLWI